MTSVDIHPEDLLDKEANGTLTDGEVLALDEHCAACSACAFERKVRASAARFEAAWPGDDAKLGDVIREIAAQQPARRAPRSLLHWGNAAAVLLALALSTAAYAAVKRGIERGWFRPEGEHVVETRGVAPSKRKRMEPAPAVTVDAGPGALPDAGQPVDANAAPQPAPKPKAHTKVLEPSPALSASEQLLAAGRARAAGEHGKARDLYIGLISAFPRSPEALVARVAAGNLLLHQLSRPGDLSRPRDAERQFAAYLREAPRGPLAEEARVGLAQSYAMLGRAADEKQAWQQLLHHHPASVHAARASQRIAALSP
jgi:hypothetical protein